MELTTYFQYIQNNVAHAVREAEIFSKGFRHPGITGQVRELAIQKLIQPFIIDGFGVSTGKVIDSFGRTSSQIDVVVYDKRYFPILSADPSLALFPVESVVYCFEVKTRLTMKEVRDTDEKFNSIRFMTSFPHKQHDGTFTSGRLPRCALIAFSSNLRRKNDSDLYRVINKSKESPPSCNTFCVIGKEYWHHAHGRWSGLYTKNVNHQKKYIEFCSFMSGFSNTLFNVAHVGLLHGRDELENKIFQPGIYIKSGDAVDIGIIKDTAKILSKIDRGMLAEVWLNIINQIDSGID